MNKQNKTRSLYFPERITTALNGIFDCPLTIVEAPMGYGKTTAVREYLGNSDAHILWQKIHDSSTSGFWNGFCNLIGKVDVDCSHHLAQLGFPNDSVSLQEAVRLIEGIELQKRTVFVMDDYHFLNAVEADHFIQLLVVSEIENFHIVLTARFIEFLSIDELSLKGYLNYITKEIFELMPKEIIKYYQLCGFSLKTTEADQLYSITEGWISALYLLMLNYKENGRFMTTDNIYKLVENAIYKPFSEDIKEFLLNMCIFDSFTTKQAVHMWGNKNTENILNEITGKNAFVNYDVRTKTFQMHNIFTNFLQEIIGNKEEEFKKNIYEKAGHWYVKTGEYLTAMHFFHLASDYESLFQTMELDKANSFGGEQKELLIKYYDGCPHEIKQRHPIAILVYAMALITYNEMGLFEKACTEFAQLLQSSSLDVDSINCLMGELELVLSFTRYNDIMGMSEHHKRACVLMKEPSVFMDTKGSWTFGSPSVLYMFYRESGKLAQEVLDMKETMPYYYQLTSGHGRGAEYMMEAEWYFNQGDFENAEIALHTAQNYAKEWSQPNIEICAMFLWIRLFLMKGDYAEVLNLLKKIHEIIEQNKLYTMIHTIDMCSSFVDTCLKQNDKIPKWLLEGDFNSNRLFFPARAFSNIIYGKVLLLKGEYLKLLGIAEQFIGIASVFPNLLANIYTTIYIAAVKEKIFRRGEAISALKQALDMALPDKVYMPFVENCDYIKSLLEELYIQGIYQGDIAKILELCNPYQNSVKQITKEYFTEDKPKLSEREKEIALLAAEGFSNKIIGERLFISPNTVKTQLKSVFVKLEINSRSLLKQIVNEELSI